MRNIYGEGTEYKEALYELEQGIKNIEDKKSRRAVVDGFFGEREAEIDFKAGRGGKSNNAKYKQRYEFLKKQAAYMEKLKNNLPDKNAGKATDYETILGNTDRLNLGKAVTSFANSADSSILDLPSMEQVGTNAYQNTAGWYGGDSALDNPFGKPVKEMVSNPN